MKNKYEREIDEIINKTGGVGPSTPLRQLFRDAQRRLLKQLAVGLPGMFRRVTPTRVGLVGVLLLLGGLAVRSPAMVILSVGVLLGAYLISIIRGKGSFEEMTGFDKAWRGRSMDAPPPSRWGARLRRWIGRRR